MPESGSGVVVCSSSVLLKTRALSSPIGAALPLIGVFSFARPPLTTLNINDRKVVGSTGVIEMAHAKGLLVHTWTFRNDASGYGFKDPKAEMQFYMSLGIDGVFTDFPATGVAALKELP
jgi:glycerophosphoryl diester phosphodiesterase